MDETRTNDLKYRVALHRVHRLGSVRFGRLEAAFPTMEAAWRASSGELRAAGLDASSVAALTQAREERSPESLMEELAEAGVQAIARPDPGYPERLREIDDSPPVIYVRGSWTSDDEWSVAIVGTRRATAYGRQAAAELTRGLTANRITTVSGLARGIDSIAHRTALDGGGRTVAVLANGLETVYPPENRRLAEEIVERGALITDYPLGTKPRAEFFPRRNRILSGLTLGTMVVEGDFTSGAMITARLAGEQNREVFAVPGSIFSPQSRGPNALLRDGATPVTSADDVLEALNLTMIGAQMDFGRAQPATDPDERTLLAALSREPQHVDEIARGTGLAAATVSATLAMLELKGLVRDVGGTQFVRVRDEDGDYVASEPGSPVRDESGITT